MSRYHAHFEMRTLWLKKKKKKIRNDFFKISQLISCGALLWKTQPLYRPSSQKYVSVEETREGWKKG